MSDQPPYFITGLPRSRLGWIANLLTWGRSFCFHSALAGCSSIDDLKGMLNSRPGDAEIVGDADPLIACVPEEFCRAFPDAKIAFVFRPFGAVVAEESAAVSENPMVTLDQAALDHYLSQSRDGLNRLWNAIPRERTIWFKFQDLEKQDAVEALWRFCLPTVDFPADRYRMLDTFRVTSICSKVLARYPHQPFKTMLANSQKICGAQ